MEKDCSRSTSPAAYSTLRGQDDGNAVLLPDRYGEAPEIPATDGLTRGTNRGRDGGRGRALQ